MGTAHADAELRAADPCSMTVEADHGPRVARRRRKPRVARVRRLTLLVLFALLVPVLYSYVSTIRQPSNLSLGVRSVEWVRAHHGAWFVNSVERVYYAWTAPAKGGPALRTLPAVGSSNAGAASTTVYRPSPIRPLVHPVLRGEGVWHSTGVAVQGAPGMLVTEFRPDAAYPRNLAYVAWIDHTRTQLALYPGRYEPPSNRPRGPMSIPYSQRWRLLGTFNSGFAYRDAHGGFAVNGHSYTPLVRGMGTVVGYADGRVDVVSWRGGATPPAGVVVAKQNLPLIVNGGRPNPNLSDGPMWGATLGNAIRVWRSGVGIDRHGNLVYAAADYQTVSSLAAILIHAGAVRAMELDINPSWPTFITYTHHPILAAKKLFPTSHTASRYLSPDDRDFFAVYRLVPGATSVAFR
jgi:hypothetical protein